LFHVVAFAATAGPIFNILVLDSLSSSGIIKLFDNLLRLVAILIDFGFGRDSFLTAIFYDRLLRNGFTKTTHSSSHAEAA
jgi:hypothetical protein